MPHYNKHQTEVTFQLSKLQIYQVPVAANNKN